jgi:flagellar basal-body rod protein FlgF
MIRGLYTATSGMLCQEAKTNVIANNLANANTAGFKKDKVIFRDFPSILLRRINDPNKKLYELKIDPAPYVGKLGTGAVVDEIYNDKTQGSLRETGNSMDLALLGKGFFTVQTQNGPALTRNGAFKIGASGRLCTLDGFPVLAKAANAQKGPTLAIDKNGNTTSDVVEINIPANAKSFTVAKDGTVYIDGAAKYKLLVVSYDNPKRLLKRGKNLFFPKSDSGVGMTTDKTEVLQGKLENSNVSTIECMVKLIAAQRNYEANQKVISSEDQLLGKAVNDLGRTA